MRPAVKKSTLYLVKTHCYNPFPEYVYHTTIAAAQNVLLIRPIYRWPSLKFGNKIKTKDIN